MHSTCFVSLASVVAIAVVASSVHAADPSAKPTEHEKLPAVVAADLKSLTDQCVEVGGKPLTTNAVKRVDLNGDGKDDFVLDVGSVGCDGAASIYGDREKGVTVYVGEENGGTTTAFTDQVFGTKIEGSPPAAKVWLTVSGSACGKEPAADFASENFCDRALTWNATTKKFEYAPVSTVRMIQ